MYIYVSNKKKTNIYLRAQEEKTIKPSILFFNNKRNDNKNIDELKL